MSNKRWKSKSKQVQNRPAVVKITIFLQHERAMSEAQSSDVRQTLVQTAVRFLQDEKVRASSLAKRIAFLESKGLTTAEIEEAMRRAKELGGMFGGARLKRSEVAAEGNERMVAVSCKWM